MEQVALLLVYNGGSLLEEMERRSMVMQELGTWKKGGGEVKDRIDSLEI